MLNHNQVVIQEWLNIYQPIYVTQYINILKDRKCISISRDTEISVTNQTQLYDKNIYKRSITSFICSSEDTTVWSLPGLQEFLCTQGNW